MRAVIYTGPGGPEVIRIGEVPKPEVRPEHIRVRVHAAGLNRADLSQRRGKYAAPPGWPADTPCSSPHWAPTHLPRCWLRSA